MNVVTERSPEAESARQVCTLLYRACCDARLYRASHPTFRASLQALVEAVDAHLTSIGPLVLEVGDAVLRYGDEEVYAQNSARDNLAFIMFRDGIRTLTFHEGVEPDELEAFVDCLSRAEQLGEDDHDLTTALWEKDLVHVECETVDPFVAGEGSGNAAFENLRDTVLRRLNELTSVGGTATSTSGSGDGTDVHGSGEGRSGDEDSSGDKARDREGEGESAAEQDETVDPDSMVLTVEEAQATWSDLAHPSRPLDDFAVVLLEIIGDPEGIPSGEKKMVDSLVMVAQKYLDEGNLDGLDAVVDRLDFLQQAGRRPAGFTDELLQGAATPERLGRLVTRLASAPTEHMSRAEALFKRLGTRAHPALLEVLATSGDRAVRKLVLSILHFSGGVPKEYLLPLLDDPRWYVVRNAVQLAADSGDAALSGRLERLLSHPEARVRREVVRSLDFIGESRSLAFLVRALQDVDSAVRITAVRGLGRNGTKAQFEAVNSEVGAPEFESRPAEEVEAFLLTLARLGGDRAVGLLDRLWRSRVFGTHPLPMRLAAIQALGALASSEALQALGDAARSGDTRVQRAATRALAEAEGRIGARR